LIPILGAILKKRNSYIFSLLVSTFLDKGISLYESFEILKKSQDVSISIFSIEIIKSFKEGVNLPNAFLKTHIFEINLIEVIQTSQISGEIAKQLNGYSVFCVEELELLIKKLFVICQTIIYLFVLLLIIVTYISILTPLYSMINNF
jgi:competence protein ComGB